MDSKEFLNALELVAKEKGIEPIPLSKYKTRTFDNFLGTFYTGAGAFGLFDDCCRCFFSDNRNCPCGDRNSVSYCFIKIFKNILTNLYMLCII